MTARSEQRWSEDALREFQFRADRWKRGVIHTDVVAAPTCRATVPTMSGSASTPPVAIPGPLTFNAPDQRHRKAASDPSLIADRSGAPSIPYERDVLAGVLKALALHPRVAWATRLNVGAFTNAAGQYVRVGFRGCSDIIGQTTDGAFLAVECKRPGAKPTLDQAAFLARVRAAGGVAFCAWSVDDVARGLALPPRAA